VHRAKRSSSRLRSTAVIVTAAAAAALAVLIACPPAQKQRASAGPSVTTPSSTDSSVAGSPAVAPSAEPTPIASSGKTTAPITDTIPRPGRIEPQGKLAVILDDAGYSLPELEPFLELPGPLTVAVLPNLPHSTEAAHRVLAAGKDLILHCPMEPDGGEDPGPGALRVGMSEAEIDRVLATDFASVPGAAGMNNHMGSRATADTALMESVLGYLKREGLFFVDSRTTAETVGPSVAQRFGVPFLQRNLFIDDERDEKAVANAFDVGVQEARDRGTAVVIGHVQNRAVLDILRRGERELAENGVRLARLEEIMSGTRVAQQGKGRMGARVFEDLGH